jgi:hypothetical protein
VLEQDKPTHSKKYILYGTEGHDSHQKLPFRNCLRSKTADFHNFSTSLATVEKVDSKKRTWMASGNFGSR